jgi:hypothetical protein
MIDGNVDVIISRNKKEAVLMFKLGISISSFLSRARPALLNLQTIQFTALGIDCNGTSSD